MKTKLIILLASLSLFSLTASAVEGGGIGTRGGGEFTSQEMRAAMRRVPDYIVLKGLSFFPGLEERFPEVLAIAHGHGARVVQKSDTKAELTVEGAPKVAVSDPGKKLTQVDEEKFIRDRFGNLHTEEKKIILAAHEVFVLIEYETDGDYRYSSQLIGGFSATAYDPAYQSGGSVTSNSSQGIIVVRPLPNQPYTFTFQYCMAANSFASCRQIGARAYTRDEISARLKQLQLEEELAMQNIAQSKADLAAFRSNRAVTRLRNSILTAVIGGAVMYAGFKLVAKADVTKVLSQAITGGIIVFSGAGAIVIGGNLAFETPPLSDEEIDTQDNLLSAIEKRNSEYKEILRHKGDLSEIPLDGQNINGTTDISKTGLELAKFLNGIPQPKKSVQAAEKAFE